MNIISKLKIILKSLTAPELNVKYLSWQKLNEQIDNENLPIACIIQYPSGNFHKSMQATGTEFDMFIIFADVVELDFDSDELELKFIVLRKLIKDFIEAYDKSNLFEKMPADIPFAIEIGNLDRMTFGVVINFKCKPNDYEC